MLSGLASLIEHQSPGYVLAAGTICAVSGWLLAHVMRQAAAATRRERVWWLVGTAVVAGTGVWTTHFMAMLGYRADAVLRYDVETTLLSAAAAILAVGLPLSISKLLTHRIARAAAGAVAGVGIAAMHVTGMAAIEGCVQTQSLAANVLACLVGATFMGLARGLPPRWTTPAATTLLVVLAVCGTHFVSIAGTNLVAEPSSLRTNDNQLLLSVLTAVAAATLLLGAFVALATVSRFQAQEKAHAGALATALQNMSNGLLKVSSAGIVEIHNRRLCALLNLEPTDVAAGMPLDRFLANVGRSSGWDAARIARVVSNHWAWMAKDVETRVEHNFDDGRILVIVCQPVADGAVLTYEDVTKARQAQKEISHLAYHDPLTGLANRRSLQEEIARGIARGPRFKLLLIDLDRFKSVNDTFGHGVGDRLLVEVANRLRAIAGPSGYVARLGGDEMAMLVHGDADAAMAAAERTIAEVEKPYALDDLTVVIGCSIGLCCTDDALQAEDLMQRADLALYEAKRHGRGRAVCYRSGMVEAVAERHRTESELRAALPLGQLRLAYQPIMALASDAVVGYEALIRWDHPTRGTIPPSTFIPLAEETGLIVPIGKWVLDEACRQAMRWPAHQHVAVNVSAVQFRSPMLLAHVTAALAESGLPPGRLEIELTETALVEDGRQIAHTLSALRTLGIKIAMDDFGTGYSSLAHLRDLPLDRIKIDRSFVSAAMAGGHSLAVIKAVAQMGRDMNIATLAEGVESEEQLDLVRALGCDAVQGYLIGRPESQAPTRASDRAA